MKNTDVPIVSEVQLLHDFNEGVFIFHAGETGVVLLNDLIDDGLLVEVKVNPENVLIPEEDDSDGWWELRGKLGMDFKLIDKRREYENQSTHQ